VIGWPLSCGLLAERRVAVARTVAQGAGRVAGDGIDLRGVAPPCFCSYELVFVIPPTTDGRYLGPPGSAEGDHLTTGFRNYER
jgi:hypothetical protein